MTQLSVTGEPNIREGESDSIQIIADAIKGGCGIEEAAQRIRVAPSRIWAWLDRGRTAREEGSTLENDQRYIAFANAVEDARLWWKGQAVESVWEAGKGKPYETVTTVTDTDADGNTSTKVTVKKGIEHDWRATMKLLEARYPGEFKQGATLEVTGQGGGPIKVEYEIPSEIWEAAVKVLAQSGSEALEITATEVEQVPGATNTNGQTASPMPGT